MTTIPEMFGKRSRNSNAKDLLMADNIPAPRFLAASQPTATAPSPLPRYRSEAAALAAQHVEDLEHELRDSKARYEIEVNELKTLLYQLKGELATMKSANTILNAECEILRTSGEADKRALTTQRAKLDVAAKIVLDLLHEAAGSGAVDEGAAHDAVAEALEPRSGSDSQNAQRRPE
jgi:hypothetical protein